MTTELRETVSEREARLQDKQDRESRPWFAYVRDWYQAARMGVIFTPVVLAGYLLICWAVATVFPDWVNLAYQWHLVTHPILWAFWTAGFGICFWLSIIERVEVRWTELEARMTTAWAERKKRRRAPAAVTSAAEPPADSYDGVRIDVIAAAIATSEKGRLSRTVLKKTGLSEKAAGRVQSILKERTFQVYPTTLKKDADPIAEEWIAHVSKKDGRTTMLNRILLQPDVKDGDRARIIGNAIRQDRSLPTTPAPRIASSWLNEKTLRLSTNDTMMGTRGPRPAHTFTPTPPE